MCHCKQEQTQAGLVTVTLEREGAIVVFKRVPDDVCENCGEYYLSDEVTGELLERAEKAITSGAEIEIRRYAA
ncbi:hypothetical protein C8255_18880 [filamentous cyanobacterium CCP3]|nr:hypothetical protein C8255_18880 [filamentous cyanobacterium CCP3]